LSEGLFHLPKFLVIGTQKGGTTTIQKLLEKHTAIFLPSCKETHYFTLNWHQPTDWYKEHYLKAKKEQVCGEITPYYLFHPEAAVRIKKLIPKAKLIVLLRDPVERAISQYFHAQRHGFETLQIKDAFDAEELRLSNNNQYSHQKHSYLSRSKYLEQLNRYEKIFPKKNILVLKSEDLFFKNTDIILEKIQSFIGVKHEFLYEILPKANSGQGEKKYISEDLIQELKEKLSNTTKGIKEKYKIDWGW